MKLKITTIISFIILLITAVNINAQEDYLYENISVADGLSSSSFNPFENIYQDQYGFLWFGTTDGLNRYDGYDFKVYKNIPGDSTSLPSSNIQTVTEDADGNLWIGTPSSMSIFNRKENTFTRYPIEQAGNNLQADIQILRSLVDSKKNFWITTQYRGVQKWNKSAKKWEIIPMMLKVENVDTLVKSQIALAFGICELRNGNLLVSTFNNGVYYYNESSNLFEPFNFGGNSVPEGIVDIYEDRGGTIWLSGRDVLIEYNPKSFSFEFKDDIKRFTGSTDAFFFNINERDDGTFLLCSIPNGIMKFDPATEKFELLKIGGDLEQRGIGKFAVSKFIDKFGVYWVGLGDNGILKFDPNRKPFRYHLLEEDNPNQNSRGITTDIKVNKSNANELLVSTDRLGFYKMSQSDQSISPLKVPVAAIYTDSSNLRTFEIGDDNKLWFPSTAVNLSSYDLNSGRVETFNILSNEMKTGGEEIIRDLEYLPKNRLVIATSIGGYIFNTETKKLEELPSTMNRKYSAQFIADIKKIVAKNTPAVSMIEVGEAAEMTQKLSVKKETEYLMICVGEGNLPREIFDFGGIRNSEGKSVWAMDAIPKTFHNGGGYKNRISIQTVKLQPGEYNVFFSTDVGHSYGNFNVEPPENPNWYGIQVIEVSGQLATDLKSKIALEESNNDAPNMYEVSYTLSSRKYPSDLWIGANENGIIRYDLSTGKYKQYYIDGHSSSFFLTQLIFEDSKGRLWITLNPSGFYRFIPETKKFISNATIPDLPNTGINGIIEDFQGSIWVSSSGGITKLTEHDDGSWSTSNYDSKDGVPGGFGSGTLITRNGEIFLGSFNGLTAFYPSTENTSEPIPVISNITISDISVFDKESDMNLDYSIFETEKLNLSYAQNDISFDFASLHFSRPSKNRVSYKLEGFNEKWIFTDKNFASFTNLEPGDYILRIKAYSGFGVPSSYERVLHITIAPPWYRTTVAYISYGFLFFALVFGIDRVQRRRLLHKEREKQKIQEAELRAIAAEAQAKAVEAENDRKTKELEEARQLQLSMLPKTLPQLPNLDIAVYMKTATEVGGDYYDFKIGMDGTLTVVIGDATGHGMKAGTMVTTAKSLFNSYSSNKDILFSFHEMTRCIKEMNFQNLSMCLTMMKINNGKAMMSSAGMPPVYIFRKEKDEVEEYLFEGMPLGTMNDFPYKAKEVELKEGDVILLLSDGLPELINNKYEEFGYKRVRREFQENAKSKPEDIIKYLKDAGSSWVSNAEPDDDITFVVIKIK